MLIRKLLKNIIKRILENNWGKIIQIYPISKYKNKQMIKYIMKNWIPISGG